MPSHVNRYKQVSNAQAYDEESIENVFLIYSEIISGVSEVSSSLAKVTERISALDKAVRLADPSGDLHLLRRLRVKVVLSVVMPALQYLDRLSVRMKACASIKDDVMADAKRGKPAFE